MEKYSRALAVYLAVFGSKSFIFRWCAFFLNFSKVTSASACQPCRSNGPSEKFHFFAEGASFWSCIHKKKVVFGHNSCFWSYLVFFRTSFAYNGSKIRRFTVGRLLMKSLLRMKPSTQFSFVFVFFSSPETHTGCTFCLAFLNCDSVGLSGI